VGEKVVIENVHFTGWDEVQFVLQDEKGDLARRVFVHPWDRESPGARGKVYLGISRLDGTLLTNIIVNRKQFVKGLLAAFPELQRKEQ